MKPQHFAVVVGGIMIVVGLFLGFSSSTVSSGMTEVSCGSPLSQNLDEAEHKDYINELSSTLSGASRFDFESDLAGDCREAFGSRAGIAWALLGVGAVLVVGGFVVRTGSNRPTAAA